VLAQFPSSELPAEAGATQSSTRTRARAVAERLLIADPPSAQTFP
jgi:hypothetical protein